jgi:hypothetical protein
MRYSLVFSLLLIVCLPSARALTAEQEAKLVASDGAYNDKFGSSVALDGNTAIIGAFLDDDNGENSGSAYVFTRKYGEWTQRAKLLPRCVRILSRTESWEE